MEKEVLIHVKGLQATEADGENEPIEIVVPGEYYFRNGSHYLRYEEIMEDFQDKPTINYVKISDKSVEVRKKGLVNVQMVFEPGKKNLTYYTTPFGTLLMGIATTEIDKEEEENRLKVKISYALDMNEAHTADCCLSIEAQGKHTGEFTL